jgi:hydrogenase 3 maturation protease
MSREYLSDIARGKIVVLGVGNTLKADDAAGPMVAEALRERFPDRAFDVGTIPESFIGPLRRANPDTVILVDAADFGGEPGETRVIAHGFADGVTLGSHTLPLALFMEMVTLETAAETYVVAIQAQTTALGGVMSTAVSATVMSLIMELERILERSLEEEVHR